MARPILTSKLYFRLIVSLALFLAAAASFEGFYSKYHLLEAGTVNPELKQTFEAEVDGTAPRPFVYRQLLPMTANWLAGVLSSRFPRQTESWLHHGNDGLPIGARFLNSPVVREPRYWLRYCIVYAMVFLGAWISAICIYGLCLHAGFSPAASLLASVTLILLMPWLFTGGGYYYDYPELAFLLLAAWWAASRPWWWLLPVAALATWNKESFLLFVPALYPLLRARASRARSFAATAVLGVVSAAVWEWLRIRYRYNSGGALEFHLPDHLRLFAHPGILLFSLEETYGVVVLRGVYIILLVLIVWAWCRAWKHLPVIYRRHATIAAAINVPLYILFCEPGELRDLSMLYATLALLLAAAWSGWIESGTGRAA
jgi:hypothetical protein